MSGLRLVGSGSGSGARPKLVEDGVLGVILFLFVELMIFSGMISAFVIVKEAALPGMWPPPDQPRLPWQETLLNTGALLVSGVVLFTAQRALAAKALDVARKRLGFAIGLGAFFVAFQGFEWASLISKGLTMLSSQLGSFFYLIIGCHALHAVAALIALSWVHRQFPKDEFKPHWLTAAGLFWYFVVSVWPVLYWLVYL
jgi:cytochrome c oxidase subunit 3